MKVIPNDISDSFADLPIGPRQENQLIYFAKELFSANCMAVMEGYLRMCRDVRERKVRDRPDLCLENGNYTMIRVISFIVLR